MKRAEQLTHLKKLNLADLKKEITDLEKQIQAQKLAIAFGKTKEVRTIRNTKRQLARSLSFAGQKLAAGVQETEKSEK